MNARTITRIAVVITIIIILGLIPPIPIALLPVPIVIQNAGFMLSGLLLGKKNGTIASLLFLLLVAIGFPFLSGGAGGVSVFLGVTAGYIYAYPVATFLIGWATEKYDWHTNNTFFLFLVVFIFGVLFIDLCGAFGISIISHIPLKSSILSSLIFIPGDSLKVILTIIIAKRIRYLDKKRSNEKNLW